MKIHHHDIRDVWIFIISNIRDLLIFEQWRQKYTFESKSKFMAVYEYSTYTKMILKSNQQKPKWPKIYFTVQISKTILSWIKWFGRRWWVTTYVWSRSIRNVVSSTHRSVQMKIFLTTKIHTKKNTIPER